jgi:hypothetical protein
MNTRSVFFQLNNNKNKLVSILNSNYEYIYENINENNVNNIIDDKKGYNAFHLSLILDDKILIDYFLKINADPYVETSDKKNIFDFCTREQIVYIFNFKMNKLKEELENSNEINIDINKKLKDKSNNNVYLIKSLDDLTLKICILKNQINELKKENLNLVKNNNELLNDKRDNIRLKKEIHLLKNENLEYKNKSEYQLKEFTSLKRSNEELEDSFSNIVKKMRK